MDYGIRKLTDYLWELPKSGGMRVRAHYDGGDDRRSLATHSAGRQRRAPARHRHRVACHARYPLGLRFPIGGVAAFDLDEELVCPAASATTSIAACD